MNSGHTNIWIDRAGNALLALMALACGLLAVFLASRHPVAPLSMAVFLGLVAGLVARYPVSWLLGLPALLPVFSFAPWSGWWLFGEWDALVLAVLTGGYLRYLWDRSASRLVDSSSNHGEPCVGKLVYLGLVIAVVLSAWRGWVLASDPLVAYPAAAAQADPLWWAHLWTSALYGDYSQAWNALRLSTSFVWALLLWPLLLRLHANDAEQVRRLFSRGMLVGLTLVCTWVVWERMVYAGLLNFTLPYRTTAGFWEMHVGGGAIDIYVAMAAPFAFWALWTAPSGWRWWGAATLAFWALYAVLTTYSRGVLGAVVIALLYLAWLAWRGRIALVQGIRTHRAAWAGVALLLVGEVVLALAGGNFLAQRLAQTDTDLRGRWAHWTAGVGLLQSPQDWLLGLGAGRLPAQYSQRVPGADFAGQARWRSDASQAGFVLLSGPAKRAEIAADFGLAQRVQLQAGGTYAVRLKIQSSHPVWLQLSVCEQHLLYALRCQKNRVRVPASQETQTVDSHALMGPDFARASGVESWREGLFSMAVLDAGQVVQLQMVELLDPQGRQVLDNTRFSTGRQHWFTVVRDHFQPWHIDNLYLDMLIERGLLGLGLVLALVAWSLGALRNGVKRRQRYSGILSASLLSCLVLGLVISFTELPRLAFLFLLLLMVCCLPGGKTRTG